MKVMPLKRGGALAPSTCVAAAPAPGEVECRVEGVALARRMGRGSATTQYLHVKSSSSPPPFTPLTSTPPPRVFLLSIDLHVVSSMSVRPPCCLEVAFWRREDTREDMPALGRKWGPA